MIWSIVSMGVELEQDALGPRLELLSIDTAFARGENPGRRSGFYKLTASVVLAPAPEDFHKVLVGGGALPGVARLEPRQGSDGIEHSGLQLIPVRDRLYLSPLLSIGSQGQKLNLRLRRHSFLFQYRQDFH
ncbi:MAG: hypothetical protein NT159_05450 [Proteobacteria bacterium]|nr:hypothetical protein [Pseudomonadota bacterium]